MSHQVNGGALNMSPRKAKSFYWNIPIANTTAVMLGMGTSVTQMAMREFARAGVMVGFCGTDGTPLYSANEVDIDVSCSARKANIARRHIYKTGSHSGLMKKNVCRRQSIFSLFVYSKLKNSGRAADAAGNAFQPDKVALETILDRPERAWKTHRTTPR
jgi:CRISPR-associated protein Cas1